MRIPLIIIFYFGALLACAKKPEMEQQQPKIILPTKQSELQAKEISGSTVIVYGGWRQMHSDYSGEPQFESLTFIMLPSAIAANTKLVAFDSDKQRLVCCFVVQSEALEENDLTEKYNLPNVWVSDLLNDLNLDQRSYDPVIYEVAREGELAASDFPSSLSKGAPGGLVLQKDAEITSTKNRIKFGAATYDISIELGSLADDDGSVEIYILKPADKSKKQLRVEVPYSNN